MKSASGNTNKCTTPGRRMNTPTESPHAPDAEPASRIGFIIIVVTAQLKKNQPASRMSAVSGRVFE